MIHWFIISVIFAYLLGAIPSAYYAGKWFKGIDLRTVGSGNVGFTNALRTLGVVYSIPVLIVDIAKGSIAVLLAAIFLPQSDWLPIANGLAAIIGHNWTIFLGFKGGGKGVATSAGVFLALAPVPFLNALIIFLLMLAVTRYVSLSSIMAALTLAVSSGVFILLKHDSAPTTEVFIFSIFVAFIIIVKHHSNIRRLIKGKEPKVGKKQREEASRKNGDYSSH